MPGLFALYLFTAAADAGFGDSVFFTLACLGGDIAHAPGYPLYALACFPFAHIPGVSAATGAAAFSALCAAFACALFADIARLLLGGGRGGCAFFAAALFGVSASFWQQANFQEAYAFNAFLFMVSWRLVLEIRTRAEEEKPIAAVATVLAFVCALGLSNHWPLFVLAAAGFPFWLWRARRAVAAEVFRPRTVAAIFAAVVVGLLPYLYLIWRARNPGLFSGLPFAPDDWQTFWDAVSRRLHFADDYQPGATIADSAKFVADFFAGAFWREMGIVAGMLALAGFVLQWKVLGISASLALCATFSAAGIVLPLLLRRVYDGATAQDFSAYPLLSFAVVCFWAAVAAARLPKKWGAGALAIAAALALAQNFEKADRRGQTLAGDIARAYLQTLPPGGWTPFPSLRKHAKYLQLTENAGAQVSVIAAPNPFAYEMRFAGFALYPPNALSAAEEVRAVREYANANPFCYNTFIPGLQSPRPPREYLLFSCINHGGKKENESESEKESEGEKENARAVVLPQATALINRIVSGEYDRNDYYARKTAGRILADATRAMLVLQASYALPEEWRELLARAEQTPEGHLAKTEFLAARPGLLLSKRRANEYAQKTQKHLPQLPRRERSRALSAAAKLFAAASPRDAESMAAAKQFHARAAALFPAANNPAVHAALRFYLQEGMDEEAAKLYARHGEALNRAR